MDELLILIENIIDLKSVINSLLASVIGGLFTLITIKWYFDRIRNQSTFQTHIYSGANYIVCDDGKFDVDKIPQILTEYRKKLYSTDNKEQLLFWNTRISTFIIFTDGKRVLVLDRKKNQDQQIVDNKKLDCHGAFKFHNPTLESKLSTNFMKVEVVKLESIPGIALEQNSKLLFNKYELPYKREIAVMLGFVAYIKSSDLDKGEDDKNRIISLSCISPDDTNLTSKTKLGVKHLLSIRDGKPRNRKIAVKLISKNS